MGKTVIALRTPLQLKIKHTALSQPLKQYGAQRFTAMRRDCSVHLQTEQLHRIVVAAITFRADDTSSVDRLKPLGRFKNGLFDLPEIGDEIRRFDLVCAKKHPDRLIGHGIALEAVEFIES